MDFRIPRSTVDGLDDEVDYFWALIEPLWPDTSVEDELAHIALATAGQRALYVVTLFFREVDNGGLDQFFHNSSGMYAAEVSKALHLLGATEHAAAFEKALKIFPDGHAPLDQDERQSLLDDTPVARRRALFEPLEEDLGSEHSIWPYFQSYVDRHPREFFVEDRASRRGRRST
jgi:hypothetical protein